MKFSSNDLRRWCRLFHRDLSFLFSGMVLIYAISGLYLNHRDTINPHYSVTRSEMVLTDLPTQADMDMAAIERIMERVGVKEQYTKHKKK